MYIYIYRYILDLCIAKCADLFEMSCMDFPIFRFYRLDRFKMMWHTHLYTSLYWSHLYSESRPTNHLSAEGCGFLEDTLRSAAGVSLVLVSHESWLGRKRISRVSWIHCSYLPCDVVGAKGPGRMYLFFPKWGDKEQNPRILKITAWLFVLDQMKNRCWWDQMNSLSL